MKNYENYDPSFLDQPVVDLYLPVWATLPAFKSKPAFIWCHDGSNSSLTYTQLNQSVQSIYNQLLLPLRRGDTVIILCPPGLELIELIFACQRAGLLAIPMSPPDPSFANENYYHLIRVISQTKPKAAIAEKDYIVNVRQYISSSSNVRLVDMLTRIKWISTNEIRDIKAESSMSRAYNGLRPEELYLIQYTSGATGIPKPVLVTAGAAVHNVRVARKAYDINPSSVIVSWLPQYHDCGLQFLLLTVISGATCVLTSPNAFLRKPGIWIEMISDYKGTCTPVPSFSLPLVVKRSGIDNRNPLIDLRSLKNLIIINEPIYRDSVEEFVDFFKPFGLYPSCIAPSYGLAENCTFVSTAWRSSTRLYAAFPNLPFYEKLLPSARLLTKVEEEEEDSEDMNIMVVNEDTHEPVEDGVEGEIWVSSPSNCEGYLGHPSLTREIFCARLNNNVSRCFVRTGDRGVIKGAERYLYVTGRCHDVIKLSNRHEPIHPHYIETAAYNSSQKFLRGGCLAVFELSGSIALVAEMQRNENDIKLFRLICERINSAVSKEEKVELGVIVLVKSGNLPKTTSGKIQRWATKNKLIEGTLNVLIAVKFESDESKSGVKASFGKEGQTKSELRIDGDKEGNVFLFSKY